MAIFSAISSITPSTIELGESVTISYYAADNSTPVSDNGNVIFVTEEGENTYVYTPTTVGQHSISMYLANTITITVTAPPATVESSLNNLIDTLESNLQEMGVEDAEFDPTTGIIGLADEILEIQTGGSGNCIVEYPNLGTEFNYTSHPDGITINFPSNTTSLGSYCFRECSLKSITLPNTITNIKNNCFYNCKSLESITLPNNLITIGDAAFFGCSALNEITIPNTVTSLGTQCFCGCSSLTKITLPNTINNIPMYLCQNCTSLLTINIPSTVTNFYSYCFENCYSLKHINIPTGVTAMSSSCFHNAGLTNIEIPNTVTSLGSQCFNGCNDLLGYKLNWTTSSSIITYNATNMPLPENAIIIIPNDTTSDYIAKSYPSNKLVEVDDVIPRFIILNQNLTAYDGILKLKLKVVDGIFEIIEEDITLTGGGNTYVETTDESGVVIFNLTGIMQDTTFTISYNGTSDTINISYVETLYTDYCDNETKLSNYSKINLYNCYYSDTDLGNPSLTYDSTKEAYRLYNTNSNDKIIYFVPQLNDESDFTFSCEVLYQSNTSNFPYVGLIVCPPKENITTNNYSSLYCDFCGSHHYSATQRYGDALRIRAGSNANSTYSSSRYNHNEADWVKLEIVFDDSNGYVMNWKELDGTLMKTYSGTLHSTVQTDKRYGIFFKSSSYSAYVRNIIAIRND